MVRVSASRLLSVLLAMVMIVGLMSVRPQDAAVAAAAPGERPEQAMGSADGQPHHVSSDETAIGEDAVLGSQKGGPPAKRGNAPDRPSRQPEVVKPKRRATTYATDRDEASRKVEGFNAKTSRELPERGGPRKQVFENADGTVTVRHFNGRQMFHDPGRGWRRVDPTLVERRQGRGWRPRVDSHAKRFARSASARTLVSVELGDDQSFGFGVEGARGSVGSVDGDTVTYPKVRPESDLVLQATPVGVKETIVLHSADAPTEWSFPLTLDGLTARVNDAGAVELVNADGGVAAVIPPGFMEDSNVNPRSGDGARSHDVSYRLSEEPSGRQVLHVSADEEWLRAPEREYPVKVDPSVQKDSNGSTYVLSPYTNDYSGESVLKVGTYNGGGNKAKAFLKFNRVSSDLADMKILDVRLGLYNVWSYSCNARRVKVHPVNKAWSVSGNKSYPGPSVGSRVGRKKFAHGYANGCDPKWEVINLGANGVDLVQGWVRGKANHGLRLSASNTDSYGWKKFASANTVNAPYLDITYLWHWAEYSVGDMIKAPTASENGTMRVTVKNDGKSTWGPNNKFDLGYKLWDTVTGDKLGKKYKLRTDMTKKVTTGQSITLDAKIKALPPGKYKLRWDMVKTGSFWFSSKGIPWSYAVHFEIPNQKPHVTSMNPLSGHVSDTLRPTLRLTGTDPDNWPGNGLKYQFKVCDSDGAECTKSAVSTSKRWRVPDELLEWSETYLWYGRVSDTETWGPWTRPAKLITKVPQPAITSHLGGKSGGGVDPGVGNFTRSATDATLGVVGPDLSVTRTYNSLDPRGDLAFGSGWSTRWDTRLVADDDESGNVVITYPNGQQARFGLNPDGSYAAPDGQKATLVAKDTGGWTLRTVGNTRYEFNGQGRLVTITDAHGRAQELAYDAGGQLTKATDTASGRSLTFAWSGGHVTKVTTGSSPALSWTYSYSGDRLTEVCNPESECTSYSWTAGNGYRSTVTDSNPAGYWRLSDADTGAVASEVPGLGTDLSGTANNVVDAPGGPIGGNGVPAAGLDGTSSYVKFDDSPLMDKRYRSVELWFKTTTTEGGVLVNTSRFQPGETGAHGSMPVLYVGTDGKLYGHFWNGNDAGIVTSAAVNDGAWHHVVLSQADGAQSLFLDGNLAGTQNADARGRFPHMYLGAGVVSTRDWPARPVDDWGHFDGSIAEAAIYNRPVSHIEAAEHYHARMPVDWLTTVTEPGSVTAADLVYDRASERVRDYTDADGATWTYGEPTVSESVDADGNTIWRTKVAVTDPIGKDTTYAYDPARAGRLVSVTNPADRGGGSVTYEYDEHGFLYTVTDPNGYPTELRHDERGNLISRTKQHGNVPEFTEYWEYYLNPDDPLDPRNDQVTYHRNARSKSATDDTYLTRYIHNEYGQVEEIQAPGSTGGLERVTTRTYTDGTETAVGGGTMPPGLLRQVTKPDGGTIDYAYTASGDVAWKTDPAGHRIDYTYDGIGRKTSETEAASDGAGAAKTTYTYDGASRVVEKRSPVVTNVVTGDEQRRRVVNDYNANGWLVSTTVSDAKKTGSERTTTYDYDERGRRTTVTDPEGGVESVTYTNLGDVATRTEADGTKFTYSYVPTHTGWQRAETTVHGWSGDGGEARDVVIESRAYDPAGNLARTTDAMGNTLEYRYYQDNRHAGTFLKDYQDPDTGETRDLELEWLGYHGTGELFWTRRGDLNRTEWRFRDPAGRVTTISDRSGMRDVLRKEKRAYDDTNNPVRISQHKPDNTQVSRTDFEYDALGRETRRVEHLSSTKTAVTTTTRDQRGLATRVVGPRGNVTGADPNQFATDFGYDALGRQVRVTEPPVEVESDGNAASTERPVTKTGFNAFGEATKVVDASGNTTTTAFDKLGRRVSRTLPDYTPPGVSEPIVATTGWEYDAAGQVTKRIDPAGNATTFAYDKLGNLRRKVDPPVGTDESGGVTEMTYTPTGLPLSVTDPTGARTEATYDQLGRKVTSTVVERTPSLRNLTTEYRYDPLGNVTSTTSPSGLTTTVAYDALSNPIEVTDPAGVTTTSTYDVRGNVLRVERPQSAVQRFGYDMAGRQVSSWEEDGTGTKLRERSVAYDRVGNVTAATDATGATTNYTFDARDQLRAITRPVSDTKSITTRYGYDVAGNITRATDGNGNKTVFTANAWGLPESTIEPATTQHPDAADRTYTVSYNARGLMTSLTKPGGVTISNSYDALGRLVTQTGAGAEVATPDRAFSYDLAGRMIRASAPGGDNVFTYNDRGLLVSATGPSGDTDFTWNADGQLVSATTGAGTADYSYTQGRLASAVDPVSGATVDYSYDEAGRVASAGVVDGASREYGYDTHGRLTSDTVSNPDGTTAAKVTYGYDKADRLTAKTTTGYAGASNHTYGYDQAGRLTSWDNGSNTVSYGWDDAGNLVDKAGTTQVFNERNQLVESGGDPRSYTARGTLSSVTSDGTTSTMSYNAFDELAAADGVDYAYDALNRLVSRGGTTLSYLGTSRDITATGSWDYSYLPGGELLGAGDGTAAGLAVTDQHTDLIGLYDPTTGGLGGSRSYDPFGGETGSAGAQPLLGYQHQYTDPDTGQVNMGTRWYEPGTGGFASRDAAALDPRDVGNANRYTYAASSPLVHTDPNGNLVITAGAAIGIGIAAVGAAAWTAYASSPAGQEAASDLEANLSSVAGDVADGVADAWDSITTTTVAGTAVAAPPKPDLSDYDAAKAWLWRSMAAATGTAAAVDAISGSGGSPGSGSGPDNYLPQCGYACAATLGTGAGGVAAVTVTTEQLRQQYWNQEVNERANTKAPRPDLNTTVRKAAENLWKAVNDPGNNINLGTIEGSDGQDDEPYQPDATEPGVTGPGALPPAQGQPYDSCVTGGHTSASGSRSSQIWQCGDVTGEDDGDGVIWPHDLRRTEALSGNASRKRVDKFTKMMKSGQWPGGPVLVAQDKNSLYIVDGHHRVAAAKRARVHVPYSVASQERVNELYRDGMEQVVRMWAEVGPDRIHNPYRKRPGYR
ncbi:LamG-like jellyroll fold domain-containing protein [Haloechinothrix salitolerans]|uniref:LamG-like jellyroll fold domain-containing protein n=1 Tax=Haloechinothrix salitolerans TaxID=926830 RepID=A0ABW2BUB8_9PSEU